MLKIKDNVDLKELEKFGFKKYGGVHTYDLYENYGDCVSIQVAPENKIIDMSINYEDGIIDNLDIIYDLIQAGLVEKVE